jgi:aspartyl-tRNA(Asn)/glutamyl-tRNA(Gln) amidotransferase subunit A
VAGDVARPVRAALEKLERRGATLAEVRLPTLRDALAAYYVINYAELASAMQRFDGTRYGAVGATAEDARASFGDEVKRRILLGTFVTSREERGRWYDAAVRVRAAVAADLARALRHVDLLAMPTMPVRAFRLGERIADPRAMYAADVLTVPANLAGVPAGSVPLRVDGLPVGLQLVGRRFDDAKVLGAMRLAEETCGT